jgi:heme exporter protein D
VFSFASSLQQLVWLLVACGAAVVFVLVFHPLIIGIARAAVLVVRPRLTREERQGRAQMRTARLVARMIAKSSGPSLTAELRAIAARG